MNPELSLIALVGMPGAGKSEAAEFFRSKNIPVLRFGDQTDIGLKEMGLPLNEANERMYREKIRSELGMAAMAIKIEPRVIEAAKTSSTVVLDGLYSWEEYKFLIEKFPSLTIVCIFAPPEIRYERLAHRAVRPLRHDEAQSRDYAEIEKLNKGGPIAMADIVLVNTGTKTEFVADLEAFYNNI